MSAAGNFLLSYMQDDQKLVVSPHLQSPNATEAGLYYRPSAVFVISNTTKYPVEAATFLNFHLNNEESMSIIRDNRGIPLNIKVLNELLGQGLIDKQNIRYQHFQMMEGLNLNSAVKTTS